MKNRKLRMGMVGGGSDAFIGAIHRRAAFMDNQIELVCGCFSVDPEISKVPDSLISCRKTVFTVLIRKCSSMK